MLDPVCRIHDEQRVVLQQLQVGTVQAGCEQGALADNAASWTETS